MECYVDDMVVNSLLRVDHLEDIVKTFAVLRNSSEWKVLGFHGNQKWSNRNIIDFVDSRNVEIRNDINHRLQMHSSLVQRLSFERELEGHQGCVNSVAWNSSGSLLVSGSDDALINIWSYSSRKLLHSIESGHSANIFCTKFVPETCDELVVSGAGDAEVRQFNLSLLTTGKPGENAMEPSALFRCHSRRVKKLAVEVGNPNVVWSASEDGTLRQHDFREGTSCPPNGSSHQECRSALLDLRCGAKKSLAEPPKQCLSLKSCDISTTRPHLLLVGGSDAFARLYDRRMLPPLSSCQTMTKPPPCVDYYCPIHLSDRRTPSLHLTHVTFSPTGEEVLLSYSGEHVYLMDVYSGGGNVVKYSVDDVSEQYKLVPTTSKTTSETSARQVFGNDIQRRRNSSDMLGKCKELVEIAEASLRESKNYYGIEACSEVLDGNASVIGPHLRHECLCTRAALLLKRKWKNYIHMAIRDCKKARSIEPLSFKAHFYMSEALLQLGKHKEALEYAIAAQLLAPSNSEVAERVISIKEHLAAAEAEKSNANDGQSQSEDPPGRMRTSIDVLNSDAPVDDVRSREDSDYEAEVELDFETSMSGDEANAAHSGSHINFRFRRRSDSAREISCTNGSRGSTSSSSSQNDNSSYQPETVVDMKQRYVGHCNVGTDIKQASFLGQRGEYVTSGSDDGRWFIWEKRTGRLVKMLSGDEAVVNCVQCHPFDCTIATSGIDNTIKIWTPEAPAPSIVAGVLVGPEMADVLSAMETNQNKLSRNRNVLPFELLERFRMHEFAEGTLHPFECAQT